MDKIFELTNKNKKHNTYFLGIVNMDDIYFDGLKKTHKETKYIASRINDYFSTYSHNLNLRGNWLSMSLDQAKEYNNIDFCITNFTKYQAKSTMHFRILLDTNFHFISNKKYFYEKFKGEEFLCDFTCFTARSILNGTKINLYKFWAFYVIYLTFHISFLIFSYHMHYKNNFHNVLF
jgi:hypothetical protein